MRKQRYLTQKLFYLSSMDVEERFVRFLREQYGEKEEYVVDLSKKDIAIAIGTIPETFSRLLVKLTNNNEITWNGKNIRLRTGFWKEFIESD